MAEFQFTNIEPRTIDGDVLDQLRNAIICGEIALGSHLREKDIADQMGVSRIPIREAFRALEQEGLVERLPQRGCYVINFTEDDILEVFSLRATLEIMSFDWALPNMDVNDIDNLRMMIDEQTHLVATRNYEDLARRDLEFHEYIVRKTGHSRLLKSWHEQTAQCQMLLTHRFRKLSEYTPESVVEDHKIILNALIDQDIQELSDLTSLISKRVSNELIKIIDVDSV